MYLMAYTNPSLSIKAQSSLMNTNDRIIRIALKTYLEKLHARDSKLRIVEEFGVEHGAARVDVAVVK